MATTIKKPTTTVPVPPLSTATPSSAIAAPKTPAQTVPAPPMPTLNATASARASAANPAPISASTTTTNRAAVAVPSPDPFAKAGFTSKDHYADSQQTRYNQAISTGDVGLQQRLLDDAKRAGYSLTNPNATNKEEVVPSPDPVNYNPGYVPAVDLGGYILSPEEIQAEAQKRAEALIQQRTTAANQAKTGIQTSYDRMYTDLGQDRSVEDVANARNLSPFSGRSDYALGMIAQERARTDRQNQENLQTQLANIDVSLQDFENATEDQRQAMINELTRQERDYGLQLDAQKYSQYSDGRNYDLNYANVYGQAPGYSGAGSTRTTGAASANTNGYSGYQGNQAAPLRTLAAQNQDFNQQLASRQQNIDTALQYGDRAGMILSPQTDPTGYLRQIQGGNALKTSSQQQQDLQNLWTLAQQTGKIPDALATFYGLPKGTQTQDAYQFAQNMQLNRDQLSQGNTQFWAGYNQDASQFQKTLDEKNKPVVPTAQSISDYTDKMVSRDEDGKIVNSDALASVITNSGLDTYNMWLLYQRYGIPWNGQVPTKPAGN